MKKTIASGMRPTGKLHLGHYLGVIQNWVKLQDDYDCYFFAADWHALTTKFDKTETLAQDTLDVIIDWLACGLDPARATIYVQSLVPQIAELTVLLGMITPQNWVERDPTLKDLVKMQADRGKCGEIGSPQEQKSHISYGMLGYPVLMSSDIMAFNAHAVPVGKDQVAHIEITRDIARRFNNIYKTDFFIEPEPILNECALICGLDGQKMGKSFDNDIKISDSDEITAKKIMSAITDPARIRRDDRGNPDQCQVAFKYWQIFGAPEQVKETADACCAGRIGCADCKRQLGAVINDRFTQIRERRRYYEQNQDEVKQIILDGSARARAKAQETLTEVKKIIGIYK